MAKVSIEVAGEAVASFGSGLTYDEARAVFPVITEALYRLGELGESIEAISVRAGSSPSFPKRVVAIKIVFADYHKTEGGWEFEEKFEEVISMPVDQLMAELNLLVVKIKSSVIKAATAHQIKLASRVKEWQSRINSSILLKK